MDTELVISLVLAWLGVILACVAEHKVKRNGFSHLTDVLMGTAGSLAVIAFFLAVY